LRCEVEGTLNHIDRVTSFTGIHLHAHLRLGRGASEEDARRLLTKAKEQCLITNSLKAASTLDLEISSPVPAPDLEPLVLQP
jgi:uncharacterized OsmC-like protein